MANSEWELGFLECFSDWSTCLLAHFLPCYLLAQDNAALGEDKSLSCGMAFLPPVACIIGPLLRSKIRQRREIPGSFIGDCLLCFMCPPCALTQMHYEVKFSPLPEDPHIERE